jgi:hypothetical protein
MLWPREIVVCAAGRVTGGAEQAALRAEQAAERAERAAELAARKRLRAQDDAGVTTGTVSVSVMGPDEGQLWDEYVVEKVGAVMVWLCKWAKMEVVLRFD